MNYLEVRLMLIVKFQPYVLTFHRNIFLKYYTTHSQEFVRLFVAEILYICKSKTIEFEYAMHFPQNPTNSFDSFGRAEFQ